MVSMSSPAFTHLHVHTHYSMLDGACRVKDLVRRTKQLGMDAVAMTDHGAMFGAVEFYSECKDAGVKPLVGIEAYMSPGHRGDKSTKAGESAFHLLLLAQNLEGYQNLLKLTSLSYKEGFYYKPRIDKEILRVHSGGLIATSACLGGEVCGALMKRDMKSARGVAEIYADIFGQDRFFIEVQDNGIPEQDQVNPELAELAQKLGVGLVATNDVHFLEKDDHFAHDCLCCISMGKQQSDDGRLKYPRALYLKSPAEMKAGMTRWPEAIDNTNRIAAMCDLELDFNKKYAPVYKIPEDFTPVAAPSKESARGADEAYLRSLCEKGFQWRYGTTDVSQELRDRLDKEVGVIASKGFCSYFLIVWDFCEYARENGIPVGARGSGVGTLVGYLLGLCNVDPLEYGLLFERFMDPSRNEFPDIDIDICMNGRGQVIDYVRKKYGHVAQIITFGTLAAKAACKDVGRVMGVPLAEIDKLTKLIPSAPPGITIEQAMKRVPDLRELYDRDTKLREVIDIAKRLEGLARNAGCHAAGVVIADQSLDELVPLYVDKDGNTLTQYPGPIVDKCGLLKMDFLGLRTLTTLQRSIDLVKQTKGIAIDIETVGYDDQTVLDLFRRGETKGIFQFESGGMQDLLMKMKPDRLEDLIAANALYRPGPMELIPDYCDRKHGRSAVPTVHPIMDALVAETYGIMVYQEQVMQIFNQLGGIELASAYKLIKAISKKKADIIAKFKPQFIGGCKDKGISEATAKEVFDLILKFGGYGFNKSHSTRYAMIAYQTAYMKTYHPVEYMAALLTFEAGNTEKVVDYIGECGRMDVKVLPPDVNASGRDFTPVKTKEKVKGQRKLVEKDVIRFGLTAVRGVGEKAVETMMVERKERGDYRNLFDFCERVDPRSVGKSTLDALIRCGAFGSVHAERAPLLHALDRAFEVGQQIQADKKSGQTALFGAPEESASAPTSEALPKVPEFEPSELLRFEKELLGFYISSHPLTEHQIALDRYTTASTREAMDVSEGTEIVMGAMISAVRPKVAKSGRSMGQKWAILEFEDLDGKIEGMCFAECFADVEARHPGTLKTEQIVFVKAKVDKRRETPCLIVNDVLPVSVAAGKLTTAIKLNLDPLRHTPAMLVQLKPLLQKHKGGCDVYAQMASDKVCGEHKKITLRFGTDLRVSPSDDFVGDVEDVLGHGSVDLIGDGLKRQRRLEKQAQQKLFAADEPEEAVAAPDAAGISDAIDTEGEEDED